MLCPDKRKPRCANSGGLSFKRPMTVTVMQNVSTDPARVNLSAFETLDPADVIRQVRQRRLAALEVVTPPDSNTGGNLGPSPSCAQAAIVDTLTFTLPVPALLDSHLLGSLCDPDTVFPAVAAAFLEPLGFGVSTSTGRRINGYADSAAIVLPGDDGSNGVTNFGYVAAGGNRNKEGYDTLCVYLTGQACESINLLDADQGGAIWAGLAAALERHAAKITRLDVAFDDLDGLLGGVSAAVGWYKAGDFSGVRGGVKPSVCQHGDWINGHGRTLEVGRRENGKMVRVYEKGHQLGARDSAWVRYELELRSRDRVIPYVGLVDPTGILAGSSPAMERVARCPARPVKTTVKRRLSVTIEHLSHYARIAYGRLLNALEATGLEPSEVFDSLRVTGLPRRLYVPPAAFSLAVGAPS